MKTVLGWAVVSPCDQYIVKTGSRTRARNLKATMGDEGTDYRIAKIKPKGFGQQFWAVKTGNEIVDVRKTRTQARNVSYKAGSVVPVALDFSK